MLSCLHGNALDQIWILLTFFCSHLGFVGCFLVGLLSGDLLLARHDDLSLVLVQHRLLHLHLLPWGLRLLHWHGQMHSLSDVRVPSDRCLDLLLGDDLHGWLQDLDRQGDDQAFAELVPTVVLDEDFEDVGHLDELALH